MNKNKYLAEFIGTALLLAVVTGSGIMGDVLAGNNNAVALLGNSIATGAALCFNFIINANFRSSF